MTGLSVLPLFQCLVFTRTIFTMVGLARLELATSPLSGVRSSQLSYRPIVRFVRVLQTLTSTSFALTQLGGAGRDRTGDLLNANQALSQLSYSPFRPDVVANTDSLKKLYRGQMDTASRTRRHSI